MFIKINITLQQKYTVSIEIPFYYFILKNVHTFSRKI